MYQFFKKYQDQHEKKFPSKGKALEERWAVYKQKAEEAAQKAKEEQQAAKEKAKAEP